MYVGIKVGVCACVCIVGLKALCNILYGAFGIECVVCVCIYAVCMCVHVYMYVCMCECACV